MNEAEQLESISLFLSAVQELRGESPNRNALDLIPLESRTFANLVADSAGAGNAFARRFLVLTNVAGKHCPDFVSGMGLARCAGLIHTHFLSCRVFFSLNFPRRRFSLISFNRDYAAARELAAGYLQAVGL